jgi:hypothetical protein
MSDSYHTFDTRFSLPGAGSADGFSVERYRPARLRHSSGIYSQLALTLAIGMQRIHRRAGVHIGAERLAQAVAKKEGAFYVACKDGGHAPDDLLAYAYTAPHAVQGTLDVPEFEAIDAELGTDVCRYAGAAVLHCAVTDSPDVTRVTVHGRREIPETRDPEYIQGLGFRMMGRPWGQGAMAEADRATLEARLASIYQIQPNAT